MSDVKLSLPGQPPTDPAYTRFVEGLTKAVAERDRNWRWRPNDQHWYVYAPSEWILEDLAVAKTSANDVVRQKAGTFPAQWEIHAGADFTGLPSLFGSLAAAYTLLHQRYPGANLVWTPWDDGVWRNAIQRPPSTPRDPGKPRGTVPREALERIERVEEFERLGKISRDDAAAMTKAIIAEYT